MKVRLNTEKIVLICPSAMAGLREVTAKRLREAGFAVQMIPGTQCGGTVADGLRGVYAESAEIAEPMMVFAGFGDGALNRALATVRGVRGWLKAVATDTNRAWTWTALAQELCAERAAFYKAEKEKTDGVEKE